MSDVVTLEPSRRLITAKVTIANGESKSAIIDLQGRCPVGFRMPAAFTGTALTFEASVDKVDSHFAVLKDSAGATVTITVAAGTYVVLAQATKALLAGVMNLKVVSGSAEGAAREIEMITGMVTV